MLTKQMKPLSLVGALVLFQTSFVLPTRAELLQAGVEEQSYRLAPANGKKDEKDGAKTNPLRLARAAVDDDEGGLEKPQMAPLQGMIDDSQPHSFDLGAERESEAMVLAWERWHHQFSAVVFQRWRAVNRYKGRAQLKITVTRDLHITVECLKCRGCSDFENTILQVVNSLDLNPGLTFPTQSERQSVTFVTNLVAGNVPPGYTWDKRDFETVKKDSTPSQ
jgi:hypothetical protein